MTFSTFQCQHRPRGTISTKWTISCSDGYVCWPFFACFRQWTISRFVAATR